MASSIFERLDTRAYEHGGGVLDTLSYGYDSRDRLTSISSTAGINRVFGLDALSRITDDFDGTHQHHFDFDANGNRTAHTEALTSLAESYDTNPYNNQLNAITGAYDRSYSYDALGNVTSRTSTSTPSQNQSYAFDALNRMQSVTTAAGTTSYLYDASNLRAKKAGPSGTE